MNSYVNFIIFILIGYFIGRILFKRKKLANPYLEIQQAQQAQNLNYLEYKRRLEMIYGKESNKQKSEDKEAVEGEVIPDVETH